MYRLMDVHFGAYIAILACLAAVASSEQLWYSSIYGNVKCSVNLLVRPASTADTAAAVKSLYMKAQQTNATVKVRATHEAFHTTTSMPCPEFSLQPGRGAEGGATAPITYSAALLLDKMSKVLDVDRKRLLMRVQSGISVGQLLLAADKAGLALPLVTVPSYTGLTLGGVLATAATGTGAGTSSSLVDTVREITWVDGTGGVRTSSRESAEGRALMGGAGVVGVMTELLLAVQPRFLARVESRMRRADGKIVEDIQAMLKETPHLTVIWRPDLAKYSAHLFSAAPEGSTPNATASTLDLNPIVSRAFGLTLAEWQKDAGDFSPASGPLVCGLAVPSSSIDLHIAKSAAGGGAAEVGVADANRLVATGCGPAAQELQPDAPSACFWDGDNGAVSIQEAHFVIGFDQLVDWVKDVRAVLAADLTKGGTKDTCLPPGYIWLRFGNATLDYASPLSGMGLGSSTGPGAGGVIPVHVQMSFMRSMRLPQLPIKHSAVLDVLELMTLCKYKGRPHWGKNHIRTFTHPGCPLPAIYPQLPRLLEIQRTSDPLKMFEPQIFTHMVAGTQAPQSQGCSLRGECYCSADMHCAKGWSCVPSQALPEYRVCAPVSPLAVLAIKG